MEKLEIVKERVIDASPEEIWKVITNPGLFSEWMFVPGVGENYSTLSFGSKIYWKDDQDIIYLTGEVIDYVPNTKLIISLQDISWTPIVPAGDVTYEYHISKETDGTRVRFYLGDLSVDPKSEGWYNSYNTSDEISAIERIIQANR